MGVGRHGWVVLCLVQGCFLSHERGPEPQDAVPIEGQDARPLRAPPPGQLPRVPPDEGGVVEQEYEICARHSYSPLPHSTPVDIIWAVDSSQSMTDERQRVAETINSFVQAVEARDSNVRVVMVTATDNVPGPLGNDPDRYLFVPRHVASEMPLQVLVEHLPDYRDFLRPEAYPHFIAVTDDESEMSADAFMDTMTRELGQFTFHAVASEDLDGFPCRNATPSQDCVLYGAMYPSLCGGTNPGVQYFDLAQVTGGQQISICSEDWGAVFDLLAEAVLDPVPVPCEIGLGERPDGVPYEQVLARIETGETIELTELGSLDECAQAAWAFYRVDDGVAGISLCPSVCEQLESSMGTLVLELDCYTE